jgi:hypothetical protein
MKPNQKLAGVAICVALLIGTAGCFPTEVNDLVSGGMKLASGQIGALTAGEIKAVSDAAINALNSQAGQTGETLDTITLEEAQAVVTFFDVNGIETYDDLASLAQEAQQNPDAVQGIDELAAAFGEDAASFDPARLESLFGTMSSGYSGGMGPGPGGAAGRPMHGM